MLRRLPPRLIATVLAKTLASTAPSVSVAQESSLNRWLTLVDPDRMAESLLQYGILAVRTQLDLTYGDLSADTATGHFVMTAISLWPLPDWDDASDCVLSVGRLTVTTTPPERPSLFRARLSAYGVTADPTCVPPEARGPVAMLGLDSLTVPHLTVSLDYDVPSAGAQIALHTAIDGVAAADLTADFSYLWFDGRDDMEDPDPVMYLNSARLAVENLGGWSAVQGLLPPGFGDPASAEMALGGLLGVALLQMNQEAAAASDTPPEGNPAELSPAQQAFLDSVTTSWVGFLKSPERLVLETGFSGRDVYLDFEYWEEDPRAAFAELQPRLALVPSPARQALPASLVQQALTDGADPLSLDDQIRVGAALATGMGVPRHVTAGINLLIGPAREGHQPAVVALARALEDDNPIDSYGWSLMASANGDAEATARLDRLEREIGVKQTLALQDQVSEGAPFPEAALQTVSGIRTQARARLTGSGVTRSDRLAAIWAKIARAAGDAEAGLILEEIDTRMRSVVKDDATAWAEAEADASGMALDIWLKNDLAARYSTP